MIRFSGTAVVIEDHLVFFAFPGAVDPHITFGTGTAAVTDHFKRSFICMDQG